MEEQSRKKEKKTGKKVNPRKAQVRILKKRRKRKKRRRKRKRTKMAMQTLVERWS